MSGKNAFVAHAATTALVVLSAPSVAGSDRDSDRGTGTTACIRAAWTESIRFSILRFPATPP
jgi:hypothetical protein